MLQGMKELEYPERLKSLGLWTLEERSNCADLIEVFKLSPGNTALSLESFFVMDTGSRIRGHSVKLRKPHCYKDIRKYFFSLRVINRWNSLPDEVVLSSSINSFKSHLQRIREAGTGLFAPKTIRSRARKFQVWNFRSLELLHPGTYAPTNEYSKELILHYT